LLSEYEEKRYPDWPQFSYLDETISTERQLWTAPFVPVNVNFILLVFEIPDNSSAGSQALLDFSSQPWIYARRAVNRHPLAAKNGIRKFPAFMVLQRGAESPVLLNE
jgi:hypothetical protein